MNEALLQDLGLTGNEVKVYLTLLRMGSGLAGEITEKSGIHRRNVYDSIERLIKKGLISFVITNNRKYFHATDPNRLLAIIDEQRQELVKKEQEIRKILPELLLSKKMAAVKQEVAFFKGAEGLKSVYEDILRTKRDYIGYGPGEQLEKILRFYFQHFVNERKKRKLHSKLIYNEKSRDKAFVNTPLSQIRYFPEEFSSHAALRIYGNKVAIMLLSEEEPLAIVIDNKAISDGYRKYFDIIWKAAKT